MHRRRMLHLLILLQTSLIAAAVVTAVAMLSLASPAEAADSVQVTRDGRYLVYRLTLGQLGEEEQRIAIEQSVQLLQNEIGNHLPNVRRLRRVSTLFFTSAVMNRLAAEARRPGLFAGGRDSSADSALLFFSGFDTGSFSDDELDLAGDLGLVVHISKIVQVDTADGSREAYMKLGFAWVAIPHGSAGVSEEDDSSRTSGVVLIRGEMKKARDFRGLITGATVDDPFSRDRFQIAARNDDDGAEADFASKTGLIAPLETVIGWLGAKPTLHGVIKIPAANTDLGVGDEGKTAGDKSQAAR